jgi:hypothetical protein
MMSGHIVILASPFLLISALYIAHSTQRRSNHTPMQWKTLVLGKDTFRVDRSPLLPVGMLKGKVYILSTLPYAIRICVQVIATMYINQSRSN